MAHAFTNTGVVMSDDKDPAYLNNWAPALLQQLDELDEALTVHDYATSYEDEVQSRQTQKDCALSYHDKGNVTGSITLDYTDGHVQRIVLTGNTTITAITNPSPTDNSARLELHVKQNGTGGYTLTYPASVDFGDAGAPVVTTTANKGDIHSFQTKNAGTNWHLTGISTGFSNL